ncbi:hypothetical protein ACFE04_000255 [Oxalis oulophora]
MSLRLPVTSITIKARQVTRLLDLIVHTLYSVHKQLFIRQLNSSDYLKGSPATCVILAHQMSRLGRKFKLVGESSTINRQFGGKCLKSIPLPLYFLAAYKNEPESNDAKRAVDLLFDTTLISSGFTEDGGRSEEAGEDKADSGTNVSEGIDPQVIEPSEVRAEYVHGK